MRMIVAYEAKPTIEHIYIKFGGLRVGYNPIPVMVGGLMGSLVGLARDMRRGEDGDISFDIELGPDVRLEHKLEDYNTHIHVINTEWGSCGPYSKTMLRGTIGAIFISTFASAWPVLNRPRDL